MARVSSVKIESITPEITGLKYFVTLSYQHKESFFKKATLRTLVLYGNEDHWFEMQRGKLELEISDELLTTHANKAVAGLIYKASFAAEFEGTSWLSKFNEDTEAAWQPKS